MLLPQGLNPGKLYSKGVGLFGALGLNSLKDYSSSFQEVNISPHKAMKVSAGWAHSAVITDTKKLLIFGRPYEFNTLLRLEFMYRISPSLGRSLSLSI